MYNETIEFLERVDVFLITYLWMAVCPAGWRCGFYKDSQEGWLGPEVARFIIWKRDSGWESLKKFLEPSLGGLHDPYLLHDMDKAVERIRQAIEEGKTFSSMETTMRMVWLRLRLWRKVWNNLVLSAVFTNRFTDGYGPNASVQNTLLSKKEFLDCDSG